MKLAALMLVAGCIEIPEPPAPQCTVDSDCDTGVGEVCSTGVCYGGPPPGTFAAILTAPSSRPDLISVEKSLIELPANGDLGTLALETPVHIAGRIEAFCPETSTCPQTTIGASILVSRAPLFPGGAGFSASATAKVGLPRGTNSFSIAVPKSRVGEPPYIVHIVPTGGGALPPPNGSPSAAELAPPTVLALQPSLDTDTSTIFLGSKTSPVISGTISDGSNHPLGRYRVVARGKLPGLAAVTDVSTVVYTTNGQFSLTLADGAIAPISIVATSYDVNVVAPTLTLSGLFAATGVHNLAAPVNVGAKTRVRVRVQGLDDSGAVAPVIGAKVVVTSSYDPPLHDNASAKIVVEGTTHADTGGANMDGGTVDLDIVDGSTFASTYTIRVVPPVSSSLGVVFDQPLVLDGSEQAVRLPQRILLRGQVTNADATPASGVSVTASPSLRFMWSQPTDPAAFLSEIPAATAVVGNKGDFSLYVDPIVATVWGFYDLTFDSTVGTSFTLSEIEIPRDISLTTLSLPDTHLPAYARLHGALTDSNEQRVTGGEIRIFQIASDTSLCGSVLYPPADCVIPAELIGHAASDETGAVQLTLPR